MAGVRSIEHGDGGNDEVFSLMAERGVALCPTLAAGEAISRYQGWDGVQIERARPNYREAGKSYRSRCGRSFALCRK